MQSAAVELALLVHPPRRHRSYQKLMLIVRRPKRKNLKHTALLIVREEGQYEECMADATATVQREAQWFSAKSEDGCMMMVEVMLCNKHRRLVGGDTTCGPPTANTNQQKTMDNGSTAPILPPTDNCLLPTAYNQLTMPSYLSTSAVRQIGRDTKPTRLVGAYQLFTKNPQRQPGNSVSVSAKLGCWSQWPFLPRHDD